MAMGEHKLYLASFGTRKINPTEYMLDAWKQPGDQARASRPRESENINWSWTSEHLHRTDYLRVRNLTVGWRKNLPSTPVLKGFNLYVTITNLLTLTKAPDFFWDPEFAGVVQSREANNLGAGNDYKAAPQARFYMAGIQLNF
jgi:hypothetical protein